jgi:hypothetical protein
VPNSDLDKKIMEARKLRTLETRGEAILGYLLPNSDLEKEREWWRPGN